jgi:hypothetical protein
MGEQVGYGAIRAENWVEVSTMARFIVIRGGIGCVIKYYAQHEMQDI